MRVIVYVYTYPWYTELVTFLAEKKRNRKCFECVVCKRERISLAPLPFSWNFHYIIITWVLRTLKISRLIYRRTLNLISHSSGCNNNTREFIYSYASLYITPYNERLFNGNVSRKKKIIAWISKFNLIYGN